MRLSWYADTGVAVFSIWQGGTCTGTFRLPITDLPRMIEALQRGPHSDTGHAPGHYGPGDHGSGDYGRTERYDVPGRDLRPEPDTGYSDPGLPAAASNPEGYRRTGAHGRYEETRAIHPDEGLPSGAGGYREEHGGAYGDEPATGVFRGDLPGQDPGGRRQDRRGGHQDDPLSAGYHADSHDGPPSGGYGDDPLSAGYRADSHDGPLHGGYGDDSLPGGYRDDSLPGGYPDESHGPYRDEPQSPYRADSLPGGYRADMRGGHHDDPLSAGYADEPRGAGRRAGRHSGDYPDDPPTSAYRDDPLTGAYPGDRHAGGYPDDPRGGYADEPRAARYSAEPVTGDYPTGPVDSAIDDPDYPPPADNAGYSPARPYVAPLPGDPRETGEGRGGRRRGGGREESDPSPDSFPYGRPPAEPEVRGRRR